jgi:hypothetical protein
MAIIDHRIFVSLLALLLCVLTSAIGQSNAQQAARIRSMKMNTKIKKTTSNTKGPSPGTKGGGGSDTGSRPPSDNGANGGSSMPKIDRAQEQRKIRSTKRPTTTPPQKPKGTNQ